MNQDPQDQGLGLNQDHKVVADPIMSENKGVIQPAQIDQESDKEKVRSERSFNS
jgi:hypothetical protein